MNTFFENASCILHLAKHVFLSKSSSEADLRALLDTKNSFWAAVKFLKILPQLFFLLIFFFFFWFEQLVVLLWANLWHLSNNCCTYIPRVFLRYELFYGEFSNIKCQDYKIALITLCLKSHRDKCLRIQCLYFFVVYFCYYLLFMWFKYNTQTFLLISIVSFILYLLFTFFFFYYYNLLNWIKQYQQGLLSLTLEAL